MDAHVQAEHNNGTGSVAADLRCKFCPKTFTKLAAKRAHEGFHTKPHKCAECDAAFGRRSNLIGHMRRHRGERPFVCDLCGKGFPLASSLQTHKKQSHAVGGKAW
jgi:KRAB domain-containing zinc finger protein